MGKCAFEKMMLYSLDPWLTLNMGQGVKLDRMRCAGSAFGGWNAYPCIKPEYFHPFSNNIKPTVCLCFKMIHFFYLKCKGPLAMTPLAPGKAKPVIDIFSPAGFRLGEIFWEGAKVIGLIWSSNEDLHIVQENGKVEVYSVCGKLLSQYSITSRGLRDCKVSHDGKTMVVRTADNQFWGIKDFGSLKPTIRQLQDIDMLVGTGGIALDVASWTILDHTGALEILVSTIGDEHGKSDLIATSENFSIGDLALAEKDRKEMSMIQISPNKKLVVMCTVDGMINITSSCFTKRSVTYNTNKNFAPTQLLWCGSECVVAYYTDLADITCTDMIIVIGLDGSSTELEYNERLFLYEDIDSIHIVSGQNHEMLYKVPNSLVSIFEVGAIGSGATLFEALGEYENRSPKADEHIRDLKDQGPDGLALGIEQCIEAARHLWNPLWQKKLLRAAAFGRDFLPSPSSPPDDFVRASKILRTLYSVRNYHIGIPITYYMLEKMTLSVLLDRFDQRMLAYIRL